MDFGKNFTTKIINKYQRTNKFLNNSNILESRKAHSSSITKNEKYNLNSLIHNSKIYNKMNETRNKSPTDKLKQISKSHLNGKRLNNIITLNNCLKNQNKLKAKKPLFKNSFNIYSIGVTVAKSKDSNINSEINFSKSNSKRKKKLTNKNMKLNQQSKKGYINNNNSNNMLRQNKNTQNQVEKKLKKLKTSSPFNNLYNSK